MSSVHLSHFIFFPYMINLKKKILILGDPSVGKTSLISKYIFNACDSDYHHLSSLNYCEKDFHFKELDIQLEIWDNLTRRRFVHSIPSFIREGQACIIVFDLTNKATFEQCTQWIKQVRGIAGEEMIIVLVGNKSDRYKERVLTTDEAVSYASTHGVIYLETSALNGFNVKELFDVIANTFAD